MIMEQGTDELRDNGVYLQSLCAAETVTGSKHLLLSPGFNLLIDCGLFQGLKYLREKNWQPFPVNPASINAMILTHAHLDHCGAIPLLVREGYKGKIYMSRPTRDLTELILRDSAKLQEEDAWKANKHGYSRHNPAKPLYNTADVEAALPHFVPVGTDETCTLNEHTWFRLYSAGHIQGACSVEVNCYGRSILFSGDIGRYHSELLHPPSHPASADFVVMESTYGDRLHEKGDIGDKLALVINDTIARGGNLLVPCFAVGRAQEVIHLLYTLKSRRAIPPMIPVYLDSPMAASADKSLLRYPEWLTIGGKECSQMFSAITINQDHEGTNRIIGQKGSKIILAASGMLTGGRVLEYLKHYVGDPRNTILIIGFQAGGTRGRALLNGAHELKIHGQYYQVKARVNEIGGLSAHADQAELIRWLKEFTGKPKHVYLVHGEPQAMDTLRVKVRDVLEMDATIVKQDRMEFLFRNDDGLNKQDSHGKNINVNV
jgi:metallo-beta-lactamase family protein